MSHITLNICKELIKHNGSVKEIDGEYEVTIINLECNFDDDNYTILTFKSLEVLYNFCYGLNIGYHQGRYA